MKDKVLSRQSVMCGLDKVYGRIQSMCMSGWNANDLLESINEAIVFLKYDVPEKNCVNCLHYDVCGTVNLRKASKANDYSPCDHWKTKDD